ncbi:Dot/Icm T4SS effector AnkK/LegA5 [Legionella worsleiensis]|uniref:Putative Cardiac ankyrin repeat-containing protein K n=1 Tax=Legionella worsleiensis TaxID=45076 RepID=A0A0W1AAD1_9GAMM|nr:Dot/Icm T4SS effector AnkK/LegA5 [Legionella worsleiensis]KTD78267.1 putative Cardiac ankyrin repeat-containing protein K [Legionella worsleiensis]STY32604.1 substrate of the Dot/Icm secretion system [Legionella worsleiensis]
MPDPHLFYDINVPLEHSGPKKSGHETHNLNFRLPDGTVVPIIYKKNKNNNPDASVKEVAFSELARLFMLSHSTPVYGLVRNKQSNAVTGVASLHIHLSIAKQVNITQAKFQKIEYSSATKRYQLSPIAVQQSSEIPVQFFNQLPHGFFNTLMEQRKQGYLTVDMDSVANTFVNKFTLEEDDLHKGNMGFYTVMKDNKPHVVLFNIDHDLMLSDSIMSFIDSRVPNWSYGNKSFNITARDLINFPDLQDSANHYWPTYGRYMIHFNDDKAYIDTQERNAFINLKHDPQFNRYKWKRFLKCIMTPEQLMRDALSLHLNPTDSKDAAEINLITQATNERLIKLRAVLLSIPEFHAYLNSKDGKHDVNDIKMEFEHYMTETLHSHKDSIDKMQKAINNQYKACLTSINSQNATIFQQGDTPLHVLIRLGQYRFDESQKAFGEHLKMTNAAGQTPLEVAAEKAQTYTPYSEQTNPGNDPLCVMKHLLSQGAKMTPKVAEVLKSKRINLEQYRFHSRYYDRKINHYADLKKVIGEISQDSNLNLKIKKIIAVNTIKQHLENLTPNEIKRLKKDLNGTKNNPIAPELLFISQLRSNLWIVRAIRGLYGKSSTKIELNRLLNTVQGQPQLNAYHLFGATQSASDQQEEKNTPKRFSPK